MQGVIFYREYGDKRNKKIGMYTDYCLAVLKSKGMFYENNGKLSYNAIGAIGDIELYPTGLEVGKRCVSLDFLADTCVKIPEVQARKVYPELFWYMEDQYIPHGLAVGERVRWLHEHKPSHITLKNYGAWCKQMIHQERVTRDKADTYALCGACHGTQASSYEVEDVTV